MMIHDVLKEARTRKGLKQEEVASLIKVAKQTYYRPPPLFERGRDIQTLQQVWRI